MLRTSVLILVLTTIMGCASPVETGGLTEPQVLVVEPEVLTETTILTETEILTGTEVFTITSIVWSVPVLGVVIDETITVIDVDPNSAADMVGIQKGDVLVAVDGVSFATDKAQAKQILWAIPPEGETAYERWKAGGEWINTAHTLQVQRDGQQFDVPVIPRPPVYDPQALPTAVPPSLPLDYL